MLRLDGLQTGGMFEEFILVGALAAQIANHIVGSLVDFHELLALLQRHAAARVAPNALQAGLQIWTQLSELFTLLGESKVRRGLQRLGAFVELFMSAFFGLDASNRNCKQ